MTDSPDADGARGLRARIVEIGRSAGLDSIGTCSAEPFTETRRILEERRAAGLADGMQFTYRNPARSTDPGVTLDGCRSLVVGAVAYPSALPPAPDRPGHRMHARIARYASADHYDRLRAALGDVATALRTEGHRAIVLADENGLVDRAAAHRAGLGWYGKNANILLPGRGSWFVLGSVLTTADLGGDPEPVADGCGTCRRCLDGCPTGAIVAPGVVDAGRCLSWLLQRTGEFPREHRRALADRIYGCDDCQEVCPPTRRTPEPTSVDDPGRVWLDVTWLLRATDEDLMDRIGRWYIPDRDPRYVRRNALVVLGNLGRGHDAETEALLSIYLGGDDELLISHAAWAALALDRADLLDDPRWADHPAVVRERRCDVARPAPPAASVRQDGAP